MAKGGTLQVIANKQTHTEIILSVFLGNVLSLNDLKSLATCVLMYTKDVKICFS